MAACTSVAALDEQFFAIESVKQKIEVDMSYCVTGRSRAKISSIEGVLDFQEHH